MTEDIQPKGRQRGRELVTVLFAFALAALFGKGIVTGLKYPPFFVSLFVFLALYAIAYFFLWRLTDLIWR